MNASVKRLARWFLVSGCVGVLVAILLYVLGAFAYSRPFVVHAASVLCPEMILGLAEPTSSGAILLLLGFVLGTNFLLYGVVGTVLGIFLHNKPKPPKDAAPSTPTTS